MIDLNRRQVVMTDEACDDFDEKFHNLSYPGFLDNKLAKWFWKKWYCPQNMHLFDEVLSSSEAGTPGHYLGCDCCGLVVEIGRVFTEKETCDKIEAYYDRLIEQAKRNKKNRENS